jgi:hypothetical protein
MGGISVILMLFPIFALLAAFMALIALVILIIAATAGLGVGGMLASTQMKNKKLKRAVFFVFSCVALLAFSWVAFMLDLFVNPDSVLVGTGIAAVLSIGSLVLNVISLVHLYQLTSEVKTIVKVLLIVLLSLVMIFVVITVALLGYSLVYQLSLL